MPSPSHFPAVRQARCRRSVACRPAIGSALPNSQLSPPFSATPRSQPSRRKRFSPALAQRLAVQGRSSPKEKQSFSQRCARLRPRSRLKNSMRLFPKKIIDMFKRPPSAGAPTSAALSERAARAIGSLLPFAPGRCDQLDPSPGGTPLQPPLGQRTPGAQASGAHSPSALSMPPAAHHPRKRANG